MRAPFSRVLCLLGITLLTVECLGENREDAPQLYADDEGYAVYATVLRAGWVWNQAKLEPLLILQETEPYERAATVDRLCVKLEDSSSPFAEVLSAYVKANRKSVRLDRKFPVERAYTIVSRDDLRALSKDYSDKSPRGIVSTWFSAIGFNAAKTLAVVHMGHSCGPSCGGGTYYFLEKKDGKWQLAKVRAMTCAWGS